MRRRYKLGKCQDCGRERRVTLAVFWVNGYQQRYCSECIRMYRPVLMRMSTSHPSL